MNLFIFLLTLSCLLMNSIQGAINIVTNTTSTDVTYGSSARLTCTITPITFTAFSWILESTTQSNCRTDTGKCIPNNKDSGRVRFSTYIASSEFYYDISKVQSSDAGTYTCRHGTSSQQGYEETSITVSMVSPIKYVTMVSPSTDLVTVVHNTDTPYFVCVTSPGLPQASIRWYLDNPSMTDSAVDITSIALAPTTSTNSDGLIETTRRLTYRPSTIYNGWSVYCTASNTAGSTFTSSRKPTLNIQFPPTVQLTISHRVIEGQSLSISCTITVGNPTATTYRWTRRRDEWSQTSSSMTLSYVKTWDATVYTCTATNTVGSASDWLMLDVLYGPSEPVIRCIHCNPEMVLGSSLNVIDGRSINITCGESDCDPASSYSWSGTLTSQIGTLSYSRVSKTQAGDLTCTATNIMTPTIGGEKEGQNKKTVPLNILYKPTVGNMAYENIVELNAFSKTCPVTPGNPTKTTVRWTRSTGGGWSRTTKTLTISQLQREDTAVYTCTAHNIMNPTGLPQENGQDSKTFTLKTLYKPDVEVTTTNTTESVGSAEIRCVATGVPSFYTYQSWRHTWIDGTVINHKGGLGSLPTLRLSDLTYQHSGIYTCMANNGVTGSRNPDAGHGHVFFLVRSKPVITSPVYNNGDHYKLIIGLNEPSSFYLEYYSNAGDTTVTVENGGRVVVVKQTTSTNVHLPVFTQTVSASGVTVTLSVNIEIQTQFGRYEVVVQNDVNSVQFNLVVSPKQPPDGPTQLTSSEVAETTAVLTWTRGFHGGSDQTFVVQLSTDSTNWTNKTYIIDGQKEGNTSINITLDNLSPGTFYLARVYSFSQKGRKQEFSNVNLFTTAAAPALNEAHTSYSGGIIGGSVAGTVVIILVIVVIVLARKYELSCRKKTDKAQAKAQDEIEQNRHYDNIAERNEDNLQASEQVSYSNIGTERASIQSPYEFLSASDVSPSVYSSLNTLEMRQHEIVASTPVKVYENLKI